MSLKRFSSSTELDHGFNFIQKNLHWLLHVIEGVQPGTHEYDILIGRLANQLANQIAVGANMTMEERDHYRTYAAHARAIKDAIEMLSEMNQVPYDTMANSTFQNIVPIKGNAQGDPNQDRKSRVNEMEAARLRGVYSITRTSAGTPQRPSIEGMEIYNQTMSSKATSGRTKK